MLRKLIDAITSRPSGSSAGSLPPVAFSGPAAAPDPALFDPLLPWMKGMYVSYRIDRKGGSWQTVTLRIEESKGPLWGLLMLVNDQDRATALRFDIPEIVDGPAQAALMKPKGISALRGKPDPAQDVTLFWHLLQIGWGFSRRMAGRAQSGSPPAVRRDLGCGIGEALRIESPMPAGYVEHQLMNPRVPILGLAGVETSNGSVSARLLSFGVDIDDLAVLRAIPGHLNFTETQTIRHGPFSLDHPIDWVLAYHCGDGQKQEFYAHVGGAGNEARIVVTCLTGSVWQVESVAGALQERLHAEAVQFGFKEPMSVSGRSSLDGHPARLFRQDVSIAEQLGWRVLGLHLSPDHRRMAEVLVFANCLLEDGRLRSTMDQRLARMEQMAMSFRFE